MKGTPKFSASSLVDFQRKLTATLNPVEVWPQSFYTTLYSTTNWPGVTFHNLRNPEHLRQVLVQHADAFEKAPLIQAMMTPLLGEGLLTIQGQRWQLQRKAISPAFRRDALLALTPRIAPAAERVSRKIVDQAGNDPVEIMPLMSEVAFLVIASLLFGPIESPMDERQITSALATYLEGVATPDLPDVRAAIGVLKSAATEVVDQPPGSGRGSGSLLQLLLAATGQDSDKQLSIKEVRDNLVTFVLAGHETTAVALTWALYLLASAPGIQDDVLAEVDQVCGKDQISQEHLGRMALLRRVIMESMRLYPPVPIMSRIAVRDVEFDNVKIAAGDVADLLIYPMHRNHLIWPQPEAFAPDRFLECHASERHKFAFMPFGAGPRICIGSQLATLELATILASIVRRCRLSPVPGYAPNPRAMISLRPHDGLPLLVARR